MRSFNESERQLRAADRAAPTSGSVGAGRAARPENRTMHFKQFYLGCLAQASYLIGSDGEAAVVDPRRDVDEYIEGRGERPARSATSSRRTCTPTSSRGHRELAERTGAKIYFGAKAGRAFPHVPGARRRRDPHRAASACGSSRRPGHTPESVSIVVTDERSRRSPKRC